MHNIVEIPRALPFCQCPDFLRENFLITVTLDPDSAIRSVRVRMVYFPES
jgi:hypothetical protein